MTTQAITMNGGAVSAKHSLEELVDRVINALFGVQQEEAQEPVPTVAKSVHEARRLRKAGDLDGALAVMSEVDTPNAPVKDACWAYSEWLDLVRRRFGKKGAHALQPRLPAGLQPWCPGTVPCLEVVAVLGMRWMPGKVVSRGSLRGLKDSTEGRRVMVLATAPGGHPGSQGPVLAGRRRGGLRSKPEGQGQGAPGRLSIPRRGRRGQLHGVRRHGAVSTASAAGLEETSWTSCNGSRA